MHPVRQASQTNHEWTEARTMKNIQARAFDAAAIIRSQPGGERMVESILSDTDASQGKFTFKRELVK